MLTNEQLGFLIQRFDAMLDLSVRTRNGLSHNGIHYVAQYLALDAEGRKRLPKLGDHSKNEIRIKLDQLGFDLGVLSAHRDEFIKLSNKIFKVQSEHRSLPETQLKDLITHEYVEGISDILLSRSAGIEPRIATLAGDEAHKRWLRERLPENLRAGLKSEFIDSVLEDEAVRTKITRILTAAISEKLGLQKN